MIVNDVITNAVFNMGYLYQDIVSYLQLESNQADYWYLAGSYMGDFVMRFWYRVSFTSSFQFNLIDDCDTTETTCFY